MQRSERESVERTRAGDGEGRRRKGDWLVLSGSTPLHCRQLSPRVSVVSPKLPLPAPRWSFTSSNSGLPSSATRPRRRLLSYSPISLYTVFLTVVSCVVTAASSVLPFVFPSLSLSLSLSSPPNFIYPVRVAWTLPAFKYQSVLVAYGAPLMSPLGAL